MENLMENLIEVRYISLNKGKGVFAKRNISKDTIVDIAHVVPIPNKEYKKIKKTILYDYCYVWEDPHQLPEYKRAISLSISQFINHSYNPNIQYDYDYDTNSIEYFTIKNISKDEELTVNYNGLIHDKSPVWFDME